MSTNTDQIDTKNFVIKVGKLPKEISKTLKKTVTQLGYKNLPVSVGSFKSKERYCELFPKQQNLFQENKNDIKNGTAHIVLYSNQYMDQTFVDAINVTSTLKEYGLKKIHLILPFAPYARQDRDFKNRFVSIMGKTFPQQLKAAGVDAITTFDMHSLSSQQFYTDTFGTENVNFISADDLIFDAVKERITTQENIKYGAPDGADKPNDVAQKHARAITRKAYGEDAILKEHMFFIQKTHLGVNETKSILIEGNVQDCVTITRDDMADTGVTLINSSTILKGNSAKKSFVAVTHGIFSQNSLSILTDEKINGKNNPIDLVMMTDTNISVYNKIRRLPENQRAKTHIISTAPLIKKALQFNF